MTYSEFYNKFPKDSYTRKSFKNEHGERFYVIKTKGFLTIYFITGDETDWDMQPLFHAGFSLYSDGEVREIGKILQEFNKSKKES